MSDLDLVGRTALVTGVSRRAGIGYAIARELARRGASIWLQHWATHDVAQPWGDDDLDAVRDGLRAALVGPAALGDSSADLRDAAACTKLVAEAASLSGRLDILVCNQALSGSDGVLGDIDATALDAHWQTNARASVLLTRAFADTGAIPERPFDPAQTRRVIWMTSGQQGGPMPEEIAYATSKAALAGVTASVAKGLLERGIVLNTVNPGPVNTGYLSPETADRDLTGALEWAARTPYGRFGEPSDPARLIGWLCSPAGGWVVGQVFTTDGGMSLY